MTDEKKISTLEADKKRLLDALRELKKEGVTLIDDRVGRPSVLSAKPRADVVDPQSTDPKSTENLLLEGLDRMFVEDSGTDSDPYNRRLK